MANEDDDEDNIIDGDGPVTKDANEDAHGRIKRNGIMIVVFFILNSVVKMIAAGDEVMQSSWSRAAAVLWRYRR